MTERRPETEVARIALAALAPQWPEYWPEVPCGTGRVDAVGRDAGGGLHAVECKAQASLALATQGALRVQEGAFATVLLVAGEAQPRGYRSHSGVMDLVLLGQMIGFGVASVRGDNFAIQLPPRPLVIEQLARDRVARALNDIHRAVASAAGDTSSRYWTLWKQGVHEVEKAVAKQPGITTSQLSWEVARAWPGALYWNNAKAQVRQLAEASKAVRVELHGREFRYFPVENIPEPGAAQ